MQFKYKRFIYKFFMILFLFIFINNLKVYADFEGRTILVIGSYNVQNEWEKDILRGFTKQFSGKDTIKV